MCGGEHAYFEGDGKRRLKACDVTNDRLNALID